jgi:uncharacterized protein YpuA (DUF1002 family)
MESKKINHLKVFSDEETEKIRKEKIKHAIRAFKRRFKHQLTDIEFNQISDLVMSSEAEVVMWQKDHGSIVKIEWNGFEFFAVYGHKIQCIVTFLTTDMAPKLYDED